MHIARVGTALPPHVADQATLTAAFERLWSSTHHNARRVGDFFRAVGVQQRHLALPIEAYDDIHSFGDANDAFLRVGVEVGEAALRDALEPLGLEPKDVDAIFCASVTGIGAPSLDARLAHRMGMRPDLKRVPIFGLGCVAGAAGVARLHDYLLAYPDQIAVLLCVELCSLTLQREDLSVANLISSGLFGDGAAAVVGVGARRAAAMGLGRSPKVCATVSQLYPDSLGVMGWEIGATGFRVVLDKSVPDVVHRYMRRDVDGFLSQHGLTRADIARWVAHPGGPKVLQAFETTLDLPEGALAPTWRSLSEVGNLSSASVLFVLRDILDAPPPDEDAPGLLMAMGPGFGSELVLLRWTTP